MAARRRPSARAAELPARLGLPELGQLAPSLRSLAVGLLLLALAGGGYLVARSTSIFAVRLIDVRGGTPTLRAQVRAALADEVGMSLLRVNGGAVASRLEAIPEVRSFTYDRDFPHTLRVVVHREIPVLVVREVPGSGAYLVAASGRVLRPLAHPRLAHLPRLWVKRGAGIAVGARLPGVLAGAAQALAAVRETVLPGGVESVRATGGELTLTLRQGLEVRLGDPSDVRLKLAIARRILRMTGAAATGGYVDVSVPQRPVLSTKSKVGG